jgi:hypothetical protein
MFHSINYTEVCTAKPAQLDTTDEVLMRGKYQGEVPTSRADINGTRSAKAKGD